MKKEVKEMLVTALLSGEYKKGKYRLKSGNSFCVLGVLSDLYIKSSENQEMKEKYRARWEGDAFRTPEGVKASSTVSSSTVELWAGLNCCTPCFRFGKLQGVSEAVKSKISNFEEKLNDNLAVTLLELNDDYELSFPELAEIIEVAL